MAKKKRRTELDIDGAIAPAPPAPEPAPPPAPEPAAPHPAEAPAPAVHKRKVNKAKLLMILSASLGAVTLLGAVSWGVWSFIASRAAEKPKETPAPVAAPAPSAPKAPPIVVPPMYGFQPFHLNYGEGDRERIVKVALAAELSEAKVADEIERNLVLMRENILFYFKSKKLDEFRAQPKRERMEVDIAIILNRAIQSGAILKIMVTDLTIT